MYLMPNASLLPYKGVLPTIGERSFLAAGAHVIGDVVCGTDCSFWFNTVVRGDCNYIRIGDRTNVQDGTVIHVEYSSGPTHIGSDVTIGHGAVLHACTIADFCLIGMGAIILDGAVIPRNTLVAAGSLVPPGRKFEEGTLVMGSPAKSVRSLNDEEKADIAQSAQRYLEYMRNYIPQWP